MDSLASSIVKGDLRAVIRHFQCHFACILSILTLGPYSSCVHRSSFTRLFHFHFPYFAVSGCDLYYIPAPTLSFSYII